jgi:hypothetical protein
MHRCKSNISISQLYKAGYVANLELETLGLWLSRSLSWTGFPSIATDPGHRQFLLRV